MPKKYNTRKPFDVKELKKSIPPEIYYESQLGPPKKRIKNETIWLCPFHDDVNNPNFRVCLSGENSGSYTCDACGAGGDLIGFHMKHTGLSFQEAILDLAKKWAPELLQQDPPSSKTHKEKPPDQSWNYVDENGKLIHQSRRFYRKVDGGFKKSYVQSHVNEHGKLVDGLPSDIKRVLYNLPALIKHKDAVIYFTEGEKCADILIKNNLLATCCSGGAGGWQEHYKDSLSGRRVVFLEDNDQAGRKFGKTVAESVYTVASKLKIIRFTELPEGDDIYDFLQNHTIEDLIKKRNDSPVFEGFYTDYFGDPPQDDGHEESHNDWDDPRQIVSELDEVKPFPFELFPTSLREWIKDVAHRMQCPPDYVGITALVSCGSIIGTRCGIRPKAKDDWKVIPNLWGGIVGSPSSLKSPSISEGMKPLGKLEAKAQEAVEKEMEKYNVDLIEHEAQKKALIKIIEKEAGKFKESEKREAAKRDLAELEEPLKPFMRRYKTNDVTYEKLGILENDNPTGLLVFKDELVGLLAGWEKAGNESARAFFLEGWNGSDSYTVDRVGREDLFIRFHCLTVFGGIQPTKLMAYLLKAMHGMGNDGLLQRFQLLVYPDELSTFTHIDQYPNKEARDLAYNCIFKLAEMDFKEYGAIMNEEYDRFPYIGFSAEAQIVFNQWWIDLEGKLRGEYKDSHPIIVEHFGKYRSLMPALALIFHWLDVAEKIVNGQQVDIESGISAQCAVNAADFCEYLESHAHRIYGLVLKSEQRIAIALAEKIKKGALEDGFTIRSIQRKGWALLNVSTVIQDACDICEEHNIIRSRETITGFQQRGTVQYYINPKFKSPDDGKME